MPQEQAQEHSREILQQAIDARIKVLEESIEEPVRVLKYERNALAPISSLPPEVFAIIFSFSCSSGKPDDNLTRIRLSHVCHQWREIALNQPLLWSHVDFTTLSSAGTAEILARAKSSPLYLEARISSQSWNDVRFSTFLKEVQARLPHICHLDVSAEGPDIHSILRALGSPAPILEYLSLFSTTESYSANASTPDTLFDGSAPRLSCLTLCHCGISWKWPRFKGLKYLEIVGPAVNSNPTLTVWLDALSEMPDLKTLILNEAILTWASPAPPFQFDVERTVTLPSLAHFDIVGNLEDCVLALAHLDLPAVTQLSLEALCYDSNSFPERDHVQKLLPHVVRYMYGTQHTQPLQSMFIRSNRKCVDLLTWPVPDIGVEVQSLDPPILLGAKLPTRLALSFRCHKILGPYDLHLELLDWLITGLPLDGIVTLAAQDLRSRTTAPRHDEVCSQLFWLHISPKFPQLRRVRLSPPAAGGFIEMLLEDRERPLLPSLTELIFDYTPQYKLSSLPLVDALMKRVEQGVPLEVLDFRMCRVYNEHDHQAQLRPLSEVVVNVLGPESNEAYGHMRSLWKPVPLGIFLDDDTREDTDSDT